MALQGLGEEPGRLVDRLVGEMEGTPVVADGAACAQSCMPSTASSGFWW